MENKNEDEISFIDVLLFLRSSIRNVVTATAVCLIIGFSYYFLAPKMYEASTTIRVAIVAGEILEAPPLLLRKINLPLFFSDTTLQVCGSEANLNQQSALVDKLKLTSSKLTPLTLINITIQAPSQEKAKECLTAVVSDIQKHQNKLFDPLIDTRKANLAYFREELKIGQENVVNSTKLYSQIANNQNLNLNLLINNLNWLISRELMELRGRISDQEMQLLEPKTQAAGLVAPIYCPELPSNKHPFYTLAIMLALGIFLGLLITYLKRLMP